MTWIKYEKGSFPEKHGHYFVIKLFEGSKGMAFFKPIPPKKDICFMEYKRTMKLESDAVDRCIYVKYNVWIDKYDHEQKPEEILYWYKLDEMPEE